MEEGSLSENSSLTTDIEQPILYQVDISPDISTTIKNEITEEIIVTKVSQNIVPKAVNTCFEIVKQHVVLHIQNQDNMQKVNVSVTVCMEFYRILMGSLLLSFVPQKCGDHVCGITENLNESGAYYIAYILNVMTLISFFLVYLVEIKRENRLITYLDVNNGKPTDVVSVANNLTKLPSDKKDKILHIDKIYQQVGCGAVIIYVFNTIISAIVIYDNYLDNKTVTAFLTNVLFMGSKVNEIYSIANTENNIFYSAYLKNKVQYNDVDPDKVSSPSDEYFGQSGLLPEDDE